MNYNKIKRMQELGHDLSASWAQTDALKAKKKHNRRIVKNTIYSKIIDGFSDEKILSLLKFGEECNYANESQVKELINNARKDIKELSARISKWINQGVTDSNIQKRLAFEGIIDNSNRTIINKLIEKVKQQGERKNQAKMSKLTPPVKLNTTPEEDER